MQRSQTLADDYNNYSPSYIQQNDDYPYNYAADKITQQQTEADITKIPLNTANSFVYENNPKPRRATSQKISYRVDLSPSKRAESPYKGKIFTDDFNEELRRSVMLASSTTYQQDPMRSMRATIPDMQMSQTARQQNSPSRRRIFSPTSKYHKMKTYSPSHVFYESPGRNNKSVVNKTSKSIMKKIFDEEIFNNSPSRKGTQEKSALEVSQAYSQYSSPQKNGTDVGQAESNANVFNCDLGYIEMCQKAYLQTILTEMEVIPETFDEQIDCAIRMVADSNKQIRIGSMITLFELIHKNETIITSQHISNILYQIYHLILDYHDTNDTYMEIFCLEFISIIGPHSITFNNINILLDILSDETKPIIQEKVFQTLYHLDYPGLNGLIDIAKAELNDLSLFVLNKLAQCTDIQTKIIIPAIVNELNALDSKKKVLATAALNRFNNLIHPGGALPNLIALLQDGSIDRHLPASAILSAGSIGEQTLIKLLKSSSNPKIRQAICYAFAWRASKYDKIRLNLNVVHYQVAQHAQQNLGTMGSYKGSLKSLVQADVYDEDTNQNLNDDILEINSRDFIAALNRLLNVKYQQFNSENRIKVDIPSLYRIPTYGNYNILRYFSKDEDKKPNPDAGTISSNIIKILISASTDKDPAVRESAVKSLGYIGLPEASEAIDILVKCLYDTDSQIRATAAWSIGRLGEICCSRASKRLIELLRDNFWKVRTAACVALGFMGENIEPKPYQILMKILKEGTVNKLTVCEALVRLGTQGEQYLLELVRALPSTNYVMKTAIIQSFELANVNVPSVDFIIEELFRNAGDAMIQVRKACLITLEFLRAKAQITSITYLKPRNILPLFYYFLQDRSAELRNMAIKSIYSFKTQGELLFNEGLRRDPNPLVRIQCAKGLGLYSVYIFKSLIVGLKDQDEGVRNMTTTILLKKFKSQDVINEFKNKNNQKAALVNILKEVMNQDLSYSPDIQQLLGEILEYFNNELKEKSENSPKKNNGEGSAIANIQETKPENEEKIINLEKS